MIHQLLLYHWAAWTLWLKPWKICPYQCHWRVCVNIYFEQIPAMERRGALLSALSQLRLAHPTLPQLRDFQVNLGPFHTWLTKLLTMSSRFSLVGHIVSVHCREEGCIGLYIPDDREISQGPRDVPRDISRAEGNLEVGGDVQPNTFWVKPVYGHSLIFSDILVGYSCHMMIIVLSYDNHHII